MQIELCRHIKTNGTQCRAVALTDQDFCYFHHRLHASHKVYRQSLAGRPSRVSGGQMISLPPFEDRESIQLAISQVVNAVATELLDPARAKVLLYGLRLASANARGLTIVSEPVLVVRDIEAAPGELLSSIAPHVATAPTFADFPDPPLTQPTSQEPPTPATHGAAAGF